MQPSSACELNSAEKLICAALAGEAVSWLNMRDADFFDVLLDLAHYHGVFALLDECCAGADNWPVAVTESLRRSCRAKAMWEMRHRVVLTRLHDALVQVDVHPIVIKGTGLAYSIYRDPYLRARGDTDFVIASHDRSKADGVLKALGFRRDIGVTGDFVSYQANYTLIADDKSAHTIDLHWKINNSEILSQLFSYDELLTRSIKLPHLCEGALSAGPLDALLLACMHRAVHNVAPSYVDGEEVYCGDRLIWLHDIHLLTKKINGTMWDDFLHLAEAKGLRATCLDGFERARACFGVTIPDHVLARLNDPCRNERASNYLGHSQLQRKWMDLCAVDGAARKLAFLHELAFPPASYMRWKYPDARFGILPWLYLRRSLMGGVKWLNLRR